MKANSQWYFTVHNYCKDLSEYHNMPMIKVAGILSALSPNNTFRSNILSLEKFLRTGGNCKVTCFNGQKRKAQTILDIDIYSEEIIKNILGKGLKTRAFFSNIYSPEKSMDVTVDLWMIRWAKGLGIIPEKGVLTEKRYRLIQDYVIGLSKELDMLPSEFQAGAWIKIRGATF